MVETFSQRIKADIAQFVAAPTREGLLDLIRFFGGEFDQYELKESWPPIPRMAKSALAIANSGGGVILFGIRDSTLEPVGLQALMPKQQIYDTFRSFIPAPLLGEITVLDFEYDVVDFPPLRGKLIQVLAVPDLPDHLPFVCEDEWHKDDDHIRRGAIYVRSGTNTREADYNQVRGLLERRLEHMLPASSIRQLRTDLDELQALYRAHSQAATSDPGAGHVDFPAPESSMLSLSAYLEGLIVRKQEQIEASLGLDSPA
jgi:predicted HTH transcriptional regulator